MRDKQLAVCAPTGEPIIAKISSTKSIVTVQVLKYKINFQVERTKYKLAIKKLEKYLEDLILKGMADEDFNSSFRTDPDRGRIKEKNSKRKVSRVKRSGSLTGVYPRSRGKESTQGSGIGVTDSAVAQIRHSQTGGEDKSRD